MGKEIEDAKKVMVRYHNPAGRVLAVVERLRLLPGNERPFLCWSIALNCNNSEDIFRRFTELQEQYDRVLEFTAEMEPDANDCLVSDILRKAKTAVIPSQFYDNFNAHQGSITEAVQVALYTVAKSMPQEGAVTAEQFAELFTQLDQLRSAIKGAELDRPIKLWLLDLLAVMRGGLERYDNRGTSGLRADLCRMLGEVAMFYASKQQKPKASSPASSPEQTWKKPVVFQQLDAFLDLYLKFLVAVSQTNQTVSLSFHSIYTALPHLTEQIPSL